MSGFFFRETGIQMTDAQKVSYGDLEVFRFRWRSVSCNTLERILMTMCTPGKGNPEDTGMNKCKLETTKVEKICPSCNTDRRGAVSSWQVMSVCAHEEKRWAGPEVHVRVQMQGNLSKCAAVHASSHARIAPVAQH